MLKRFLEGIHVLGCEGKKILVAVSGGLDSVVLLDLLIKSKCDVAVVHANFQLRGEDSLGDERWVSQLAVKWKIPYHVRRFETNNYASENGVSTQMAARALRYMWFDEVMEQEKYDLLATAHHLNDSLETFLLNFARGSGIAGLRGIPARNGKIVRPLLAFGRIEIEQYASSGGLEWREDASNEHDDYNRNFVRHQVVPKLKVLNPSLEETFSRNAERLGAAEELMIQALDHLKQTFVVRKIHSVLISKSLFGLFRYPVPVLLELIKEYGYNFDQCREIADTMQSQPGKRFLSASHQLVVDREDLIISDHAKEWGTVQLEEGQDKSILGPWVLTVRNDLEWKKESSPFDAALDGEKLIFPLSWRKWRPGDSFFPLGMNHRQKLSDFLIDHKVALPDKDLVTVLVSGEEIVWVVGYRIDNRFRIAEETKKVVNMKLAQLTERLI